MDFLQPQGNDQHCQHTADPLAQESGPGHAGHAHFEGGDEENVHGNVGKGGGRQEQERSLGVSQGRENAGADVIEENEGQAPDIDVQVQLGVSQQLRRRLNRSEQGVAEDQSPGHQGQADHGAGNHSGGNGGLHLAVLPPAEQGGHHHRAADVAAESKGNEDQGDFVAVAHCGQGVFTDKPSGHKAVGDVVKLLEHNAAEQRQAELPQHGTGFAYRQILIQMNHLLLIEHNLTRNSSVIIMKLPI